MGGTLVGRVVGNANHCSGRPQVAAVRCVAAPDKMSGASSTAGANFIRPHLRKLSAYTPIEPFDVLSAKLGRHPEDIVKLDANENPYGPPPEVLHALGSMRVPNLYPDPETRRLRRALAEYEGVPAEHLLVSGAARGFR